MKRLFIVPNNDLEAKTIIDMLKRNGEDYVVTSQGWGASWESLEDEIKEKIESAKRENTTIYGVELKGIPEGVVNIDHHIYDVTYNTGVSKINDETGEQEKDWQGNLLFKDDRSNTASSIEQVANILGVELSLEEQFVSANDKGFIPKMEKLGEELGMDSEEIQMVISNIRMKDRLAQGITMEQEEQAQMAVKSLGDLSEKRDYILIDHLPHSKTATITDRLFGKYNNLLVMSEDGEINFFGVTQIIEMLNQNFPGGWSGGQLDQGSGFWGGYAEQEQVKKAVEAEITRIRAISEEHKEELSEKDDRYDF